MPRTPALVPALLLVLLLPACTGDEPSATPSSAPTSSAPASSAPPASASASPLSAPFEGRGFTIALPAGWEVKPATEGAEVAALAPSPPGADFADNINVLRQESGQPTLTVQQYLDLSRSSAGQSIPDAEFLRSEVQGELGVLEYRGTVGGRALRFLATVVVTDGVAHLATFTARPETYDASVDVARAALLSLRATG